MFIVINNDKLTYKKTLKELNKKLGTEFKEDEFKKYNSDFILNITDDDLDYKRDVKELNHVFVQKLYKKDNGNLIIYILFIVTLLLLVITLSSVNSASGILQQIIEQLSKGAIIK